MGKSHLHTVVIVVLSTLAVLLALHFLTSLAGEESSIRDIDILADIRGDSTATDSLKMDALARKDNAHLHADSCKAGLECINDMSGAESQGMEKLYQAIDSLKSLGRPVRIAVLGDSYIEGDILTSHLREKMQKRFGGCGVGYVPMVDPVAGFRTTVTHHNGGWTHHRANDSKSGYQSTHANISGHYFNGGAGAWVELEGVQRDIALLDTCQQSSFYFMGNGTGEVVAQVNDGPEQRFTLNGTGGVGAVTVKGNIGKVKWRVTRPGGLIFLGVSMDPDQGVVVDNFSLRSSAGVQLKSVPADNWRTFDQVRRYDLVVVMYGLNVAGKQPSKFESYRNTMTEAIETMKQQMPETGILVVGSSDREERYGGAYRTYRGVLSLINVQQQMAYDTHVAFWNLYTAMGGQGSIVRMVQNKEANLDYTHINFRGGQRIAGLMFDAIDWGYTCYNL